MATNSSNSTSTSSSSSSSSSSSTGRSPADANDLLDLRETDTSELDTAADDSGRGADPAAGKAPESTTSAGADGLSEALKGERRRSNNLEKELCGLRQQLTRFSEINPEEYARLQEAERQKQHLEQQLDLR